MRRFLIPLLFVAAPAFAAEPPPPDPCTQDMGSCSRQVFAEELATATVALAQTNAQLRLERAAHVREQQQLGDAQHRISQLEEQLKAAKASEATVNMGNSVSLPPAAPEAK